MNGTVIVSCDAVRDRQLRPRPELLDPAEQVVPAAGVEPRRVLAQLVQDLVHLERGEDRLDQDRRPDRAARDPERLLAVDEDVVPEPRLVVRLELGQVEVRPAAPPRASRRRCGTGTARSRTGWPTPARRRPASPTRRGASRAAGRRASRSSSLSRYALPSGESNVERRGGRRRAAPPGRRRRSPTSARARPRGRP